VSGAGIEARGLGKRFGPAVALADVDLEVPAGSSLAVLGANGAGKSTLLRLCAGLTRPSAGRIAIGGVRADRREARARIGLIADRTFLYPQLSARENLVFAARLHGAPDPAGRARALLRAEGLDGVAERRAGGFSKGMAQRLGIARGLVHEPEVVLLDEPFSGLDRAAADRLAARLTGLRRERRTLVLVTHDIRRAASLADAVVILAEGRIVHRERDPEPEALLRAYEAAGAA
jgi:heme exporter protein A